MSNFITPYERILAENCVSPYEVMCQCLRIYWQPPYRQLASRPNIALAGVIPNPTIVHATKQFGLSSWVDAVIG